MSQEIRCPLAVDELHRISQAAVAVHQLARRGALGAMRAAIDRRIPAGLLADPHAVLHFGDHGAADRAMRADVLADGDAGAGGRRPAGLGLAHAASGSAPTRRKPAGGEAGAAQEGAAIEAAAGLVAERGGERAAACLAFCSS